MDEQEPRAHEPEQEEPHWPTPRIWVGSLVDYNNGELYGAWLDADQDETELVADIQRLLAASPHTARTGEPVEEWGIFDFENFGSLAIGEYSNLGWVSAVARGIAENGPAFAAWASVRPEPEALADFHEAYLGHYDSLIDYVEIVVLDLGAQRLLDEALPEYLRAYASIDSGALARDLELGGDVEVVPAPDGGVWVFDARL